MRTTAAILAALVATLPAPAQESAEPAHILSTLRDFFAKTARPDGSFRPGIRPR